MMLYILTSNRVLDIVYLNKLLGSRHTHISFHNNGAKFSRVFRDGRGSVNAHKLRKRKSNTTNLNNPVDPWGVVV